MSALFLLSGLQVGGTESKTVKIVNELSRRGMDVSLAYLKGPEHLLSEISDDVTTICLQRKGKISFRAFRNLRKFIIENKVECLVCMNEYPLLYGAMLKLVGIDRGLRVLLAVNTTEFKRRRDKYFMYLYSWLIRRIDGIVFGCEYQMRLWQQRYKLGRVTSIVIYNGVDLDVFDRKRVEGDLREDFSLNESFVIGCVGRLDREKNQTALLTVASNIHSGSFHCEVLLVGAGPMREQLRQHSVDLGFEDHVHFVGQTSDVRRALKSMDVFVLPSVAVETFSNAALEAMAMSVPVILSNIGGAPEMVADRSTGFLYERTDLERLKDLLVNLYEEKDLRDKIGESGRQAVADRFDINRMFDAYECLLAGA